MAPARFATIAGLLALAVLASRYPFIGQPTLHIDDQFYLLAGHRMLDGAIPYVDIWDRKPAGLFILYAGIAALGGDGVVQYQLAAAACVLATAIVIARIVLRFADATAAACAGLTYIVMLPVLGGLGGQSPLFYNLPMAGAALLTLDAVVDPRRAGLGRAVAAMALCGLAMAIKPTAMFEGMAFGLTHLWAQRSGGAQWPGVAARGAAMIGIAIAPTALIFLTYWGMGHFGELWQASFSVFAKGSIGLHDTRGQLLRQAAVFAVPVLCAGLFLWLLAGRAEKRPLLVFLAAWLGGALAGYFAIPYYFDHYALPLTVPLSVMAAAGAGRLGRGLRWVSIAIAVLMFMGDWQRAVRSPDPAAFQQLAAQIQPRLRGGCLYVYSGPVHLHRATGACTATRFVFPDHLESAAEATALPVDPVAEVVRILSTRPSVIVTAPRLTYDRNRQVEAVLARALHCHYRAGTPVTIHAHGPVTPWFRRETPAADCERQ